MAGVLLCTCIAVGQNDGGRDHNGEGRGNRGWRRGGGGGGDRSAWIEGMLKRLDTNTNGLLDADEVAGPRKDFIEGMLSRFGVERNYPIAITQITQAMTNASRTSDGGSAGQPSSVQPTTTRSDVGFGFGDTKRPQVTTPGFDQPAAKSVIPGPSGLTATNPPLSANSVGTTSGVKEGGTSTGAPAKPPTPKSGRFLSPKERLSPELPGWFPQRDSDGDGQVTMAEFANDWTHQIVADFDSFDLNHDGLITAAECLKVLKRSAVTAK